MGVKLEDARTELVHRLLEWWLGAAEREVKENYPMLRKQKGSSMGRALGYVLGLRPADQLLLVVSMVKRGAVSISMDASTEEEELAFEKYRYGVLRSKDIFDKVGVVGQQMVHSREAVKFFRAKLVRAVVAELGVKPVRGSGANPLIVKPVGDWDIVFDLDFGVRTSPQVRLTQKIARRDAKIGKVDDNSLLMPQTLGLAEAIGFGETSWGFWYYDDLDQITEPVLEEIRFVLAKVPSLIEGLDI